MKIIIIINNLGSPQHEEQCEKTAAVGRMRTTVLLAPPKMGVSPRTVIERVNAGNFMGTI